MSQMIFDAAGGPSLLCFIAHCYFFSNSIDKQPTASFFQSSSSSGGWDDSAIGAYAAQSGGSQQESFQMGPSPSYNNGEEPALPPAKSFEQRPTAPAPRQAARQGLSDNIYAGAGTASSSRETSRGQGRIDNIRPDNVRAGAAGELTPSPSAINEPAAPLPTPAQAFERRLAENPIVPAGAFGGSRPTAHFFSQSKPSPPAESSSSQEVSPQDEAQAKWRSLDEAEKKRIASEAYKTFEKQITDSRNSPKSKGGVPASRSNPPNLLSTLSQGNGDQREIKEKQNQETSKAVDMSPDKAQFGAPKTAAVDGNKSKNQSTPRQTANEIQKSATAASAKDKRLAERAAQAEADRKAEEKRIKAEQRRARDARMNANDGIDNKRDETASSGKQSPADNDQVNVAAEKDSLERETKAIEQKEKGEQAPKQIENSKGSPSDRVEKKEPIENSVDKQNAAKGEASDKTGQQTTTTAESTTKGEVKKSAPAKNGLKAPKYDVIVKAPSEIDMPQLLQGSLTDLLKEGPRPKRGTSGNSKPSRGRSDY